MAEPTVQVAYVAPGSIVLLTGVRMEEHEAGPSVAEVIAEAIGHAQFALVMADNDTDAALRVVTSSADDEVLRRCGIARWELLRDVVVAADRMRDDWAESDQPRKNELWAALHNAAHRAEGAVYPL